MMKPGRAAFSLACHALLCAALLLSIAACRETAYSQSEFVLGTVCTITLYEKGRPGLYREIFTRLREIENLASTRVANSDIDRVNRQAGIAPVKVSDDVFFIISRALYFAEKSGGAFDPSIEPLVALWDISAPYAAAGGEHPRVPTENEINAVLPLVNWRDVELDPREKTVFLKNKGMALDLGGIAKGYAADEAAAVLKNARISRAIIDLGGNILVLGEKADKGPWKVGVQNPLESRGAYIGVIACGEKTVVTSGVYERYIEVDGVTYHHLFSPVDGYPAQNGLLSVTIIADRSIDADALSTAAFVLGFDDGARLVQAEGAAAVFVFDDFSVRVAGTVDFTLTDSGFTLIR